MKKEKEEFISSDMNNPTMLAKLKFDQILEQVQSSCLNFQLQLSPFSAVISIKKSFIRDKSGSVIVPPQHCDSIENVKELVNKNEKLESDIKQLKKRYDDSVNDCEHAYEIIQSFEQKDERENESKLMAEIANLKSVLGDRDQEITSLKVSNKAAKEASEKLNKMMGELRTKHKEEKVELLRGHRMEVKSWKKNLGEANSNIVKLENKLQVFNDTHKSCSPSAANVPTSTASKVSAKEPDLAFQSMMSDRGQEADPTCEKCGNDALRCDDDPDHVMCKHAPCVKPLSPTKCSPPCGPPNTPPSPHTPPGPPPALKHDSEQQPEDPGDLSYYFEESSPNLSKCKVVLCQPESVASSALPTADYIVGINQINLGSRVNDLSKMFPKM